MIKAKIFHFILQFQHKQELATITKHRRPEFGSDRGEDEEVELGMQILRTVGRDY